MGGAEIKGSVLGTENRAERKLKGVNWSEEKGLFNGILVTRILGRKSGTLFANDNIFWGRVTILKLLVFAEIFFLLLLFGGVKKCNCAKLIFAIGQNLIGEN